ncbi:hypothetical protein D0962_17090 [Leptolyngbyaceae cyanobacterium CCMR0082]|uniref:Uncharacterized protein n=2 Tax=Adonisia turfae TaxID=2950184 RepID=A0A6M0S8S3_9CYAN|nr:hypothetical protein [Adonisia turfae]MDV3347477.1 hypothetical protein [Leptothoe sp. LEGE 181152]NEZ56614.1 hypothetical protein [Adonisia turfae CCMR0081]NEZ64483.1 hypothetical protein [Adonisia turfae CCMR0082]
MTWVKQWNQWLDNLLEPPTYLLVLRLTTLLLLLHGIDHWLWTMLPEKLLAAAMLLNPSLVRRPWVWLGMSACLVFNNLWHWSTLVNHEYLYTYWVLVCTIAVWSQKPKQVLRWNSRWLIGLCFLFATLWKFIGGEYLDGSFLHLTFLLDSRLAMGAVLFGGLNLTTLAENRHIFETMQASAAVLNPQELATTPRMAAASLVLSYWTILIEGLVAASFLLKVPRWLYQKRDWTLIVFVITTYAVIPVIGFGALLMVMGLIQAKSSFIARTYLGLLILMPLWMPLPQGIFWLIQKIFFHV